MEPKLLLTSSALCAALCCLTGCEFGTPTLRADLGTDVATGILDLSRTNDTVYVGETGPSGTNLLAVDGVSGAVVGMSDSWPVSWSINAVAVNDSGGVHLLRDRRHITGPADPALDDAPGDSARLTLFPPYAASYSGTACDLEHIRMPTLPEYDGLLFVAAAVNTAKASITLAYPHAVTLETQQSTAAYNVAAPPATNRCPRVAYDVERAALWALIPNETAEGGADMLHRYEIEAYTVFGQQHFDLVEVDAVVAPAIVGQTGPVDIAAENNKILMATRSAWGPFGKDALSIVSAWGGVEDTRSVVRIHGVATPRGTDSLFGEFGTHAWFSGASQQVNSGGLWTVPVIP